jgi:hypothetical protein
MRLWLLLRLRLLQAAATGCGRGRFVAATGTGSDGAVDGDRLRRHPAFQLGTVCEAGW